MGCHIEGNTLKSLCACFTLVHLKQLVIMCANLASTLAIVKD